MRNNEKKKMKFKRRNIGKRRHHLQGLHAPRPFHQTCRGGDSLEHRQSLGGRLENENKRRSKEKQADGCMYDALSEGKINHTRQHNNHKNNITTTTTTTTTTTPTPTTPVSYTHLTLPTNREV